MNNTTIGLLIDWPDMTNSYQKSILGGISSYAVKHNINVLTLTLGRLGSTYSWEKNREFLLDFVVKNALFTGFIAFSSSLSIFCGIETLTKKLKVLGDKPFISLSVELPHKHGVLIDGKSGFEELLEHLISFHKYRDVAYISGPATNEEARQRLELLKSTLDQHGIPLPESHLYFGNFGINAGEKAIEYFLDENKIHPEVIIAANDNMAMGAWKELSSRKIVVPRDIALTGFDDLLISDVFDFPFTTVRQPLFMQGYVAMETLHNLILGKEVPKKTILPSKVIYRTSCGCRSPEQMNRKKKEKLSVDKVRIFLEQSQCKYLESIKRASQGLPGDPMFRAWNGIVLDAVENRIHRSELFKLISLIEEEVVKKDAYSDKERILLRENIDTMKTMATDFLIQSDILNRVISENLSHSIVNRIEDFGSELDVSNDFGSLLEALLPILGMTRIQHAYVVIFKGYAYRREGKSILMLHFENGVLKDISKNDHMEFNTNIMIPQEYLPSDRHELVVEALSDGTERYGFMMLSMDAVGINIFELLRLRISTAIRDYLTHSNLFALNQRLQDEIKVREQAEQQLQGALEALKGLSWTDELTGLYNRRGFMTLAEQQLRYCKRENEPFLVFFIDMDGMKIINDLHGHQEGDFAIRMAASILKNSFRDTDILARIGGDEFTVFATKAQEACIGKIIERIQNMTVKANREANKPYYMSMTIGTYSSSLENNDSQNKLSDLLALADEELYKLKRKRTKKKSPNPY